MGAGLVFPNVRKVFDGKDDYNLRGEIAETLREKGEDLFPHTEYCDTQESINKHKEALKGNDQKEYCIASQAPDLSTCYIGNEAQNVIMRNIPISRLEEIKGEVLTGLANREAKFQKRIEVMDQCAKLEAERQEDQFASVVVSDRAPQHRLCEPGVTPTTEVEASETPEALLKRYRDL